MVEGCFEVVGESRMDLSCGRLVGWMREYGGLEVDCRRSRVIVHYAEVWESR